MEPTYGNMSEFDSYPCRPQPPPTAPQGSKTGLYGVLLFLGLICASLLTGVIVLGFFYTNSVRGMNNNDQISTNTTPTCPSGWTMFWGRCYFLSSITGSWDTGKQDCRNRGAHLVIINSTEVQTYISSLKKDLWIGLNDLEEEGTWKWVDGSPVTLPFWDRGQPDKGGEQDCAYIISAGKWHDNSCWKHFHWICEKKPLRCFN